MGNQVEGAQFSMGRIKILFTAFIAILAALMYAGSSYLGKESAASIQSALFHRGVPQEFEYLDRQKDALAWTPSFLPFDSPRGLASSIPVIYYHGITEQDTKDTIGWNTFREQLFALKQAGYQTVGLKELQGFLVDGRPLPDKSFVLTFDDGRKDSYYPADPVLRVLDYRAVMFVITSNISERDSFYLSESELKEMVESGRWELGSHGRSIHEMDTISLDGQKGHPLSNLLWNANLARMETQDEYADRIKNDLSQSKKDLESRFGIKVDSFAFPYGDMGQGSINNLEHAKVPILRAVLSQFALAFYQPWEETVWRNYPGKDTSLVRRIEVKPGWLAENLVRTLDGGIDKTLPFEDQMKSDSGWIGGWGRTEFATDHLTLAAEPNTTGATAFLDGTNMWENLTLSVTARLVRGDSVSLLARGDALHNYIYCSFGRHGISYGERMQGEDFPGPSWNSDQDLLQDRQFAAAIVVKGNWVQCVLDGKIHIQTRTISNSAKHGRVGISVWGAQRGASELSLFRFSADPIS
jgi:peptidoglycan/xylan/chitin deacetylase (PgdA/CDA1 family)